MVEIANQLVTSGLIKKKKLNSSMLDDYNKYSHFGCFTDNILAVVTSGLLQVYFVPNSLFKCSHSTSHA